MNEKPTTDHPSNNGMTLLFAITPGTTITIPPDGAFELWGKPGCVPIIRGMQSTHQPT